MAKSKKSMPSYYDGNVLNRLRELEFLAERALSLRGQDLDLAVNGLMSKVEEYELSAARSPDDHDLRALAEQGHAVLKPLLARLAAYKGGTASAAVSGDPAVAG